MRYFVDARASNVSARRTLRVFRACGATMCGFLFVRVLVGVEVVFGGCESERSRCGRVCSDVYTHTHIETECVFAESAADDDLMGAT